VGCGVEGDVFGSKGESSHEPTVDFLEAGVIDDVGADKEMFGMV